MAQAGIEVTTTAHLASPSMLGEYVACRCWSCDWERGGRR